MSVNSAERLNASDQAATEAELARIVAGYADSAPKLAMRTANAIERAIQQEIKRRPGRSGSSRTRPPSNASLPQSTSSGSPPIAPTSPWTTGMDDRRLLYLVDQGTFFGYSIGMPRTKIKDIRKNEIVDAAISEMGRIGSTDITVARIANLAGVSSGLAHHYFGSKEQIFLSAMRRILTVFGEEVRSRLEKVDDCEQRLEAIIVSCFSNENFRPGITNAWLSFYVQAQYSPETGRLLRIYYRRLKSNLQANLKPLVGESSGEIACGLASLIDGLYIRLSVKEDELTPEQATAIALRFMRQSLLPMSAKYPR